MASWITGYASRQHRNTSDVATTSTPSGSLCCDHVDENPPSSSADPMTAPHRCQFRTHSALSLTLHKADRHLVYPEGGIDELKRLDPMLVAEQREQQRRMRQNQRRNPHPLPSRPSGPSSRLSNGGKDSDTGDSDDDEGESDGDSGDGRGSSSDSDGEDEEEQQKPSKAQDSGRILDGPANATISGLNIQLDSPELIAEWINQRKKRWPTQQVVEQKLKEKEERLKRSEAIYGPRPQPFGKRPREEVPASVPNLPGEEPAQRSAPDDKRQKTGPKAGATADPDGDDSESDDDAPPEEVASKAAIASLQEEQSVTAAQTRTSNDRDRRPICTHFLQGRCNYGDRCKKRHEANTSSSTPQQQPAKPLRRAHPRPPPVNPFEQPDLLRQLLRNEIEKHVDAVGQAIRFIVDNNMLLHVETEEGQAEEQRRKRDKIQVLHSKGDVGGDVGTQSEKGSIEEQETDANVSSVLAQEPKLSEPVVQGGMAVIKSSTLDDNTAQGRASLYRPTSPILRALSGLKYPPEPNPLIFLDPLRRDDPKPLLPSQLVRIAKDPVIRSILTPATPLHPNGHKPPSLERAIISLDALPTDLYRNAAIEMILGVASTSSSTTASSAHGAGLVVVSKDGRRKVSETDLFRMGLRVGGDEVLAIKKLADRLSVLLDSSLQLDEVGEADWALLTAEQRNEMRKLHYDREADRLDRLRKLGIDV
ncbi:uncharacterized protein SPSC_02682 [Sporisorium scitamineum]|uniref:C3H1-type domain-containing protein n=1 Tax=Sporisorium scitamineum TaxID=49012 RepID=A0A127ZF00_9BASI|nr:uncharacterized protein SPSC_02682 [Sporisorium scitamineum]